MSFQRGNNWLWSIAGFASAFVVVSVLRGQCSSRADKQSEDELVDLTSEDSFPASDPPSWTATSNG